MVPGTPILSGRYPIAGGLEHDEYGHPSGSPKLHMRDDGQAAQEAAGARGHAAGAQGLWSARRAIVLLVGWGSTQGPIREAVDRARAAGDSVSALHISYSIPLPPGLDNIFSGFNTILVVEMNDEGLYGYGQLGRPAARPLLRCPRSAASTRPTA